MAPSLLYWTDKDRIYIIALILIAIAVEETVWLLRRAVPEAGADPGIYFGGPNLGPQLKVKGEARIKGAKRPSIEGEARVEGAKRPKIEGKAQTEGEDREKAEVGVMRGGLVSPSPEIFWKIKLETIHFGAYLMQLFEMTNEMV